MEQPKNNEQIDYEVLRHEVAEMVADKDANPHFQKIDPAALVGEDFEIYQKFKDKSLTLREILEYQKSFAKVADLENDPRGNFMAWLVNQTINPEWTERWKSDWKKEQ